MEVTTDHHQELSTLVKTQLLDESGDFLLLMKGPLQVISVSPDFLVLSCKFTASLPFWSIFAGRLPAETVEHDDSMDLWIFCGLAQSALNPLELVQPEH